MARFVVVLQVTVEADDEEGAVAESQRHINPQVVRTISVRKAP